MHPNDVSLYGGFATPKMGIDSYDLGEGLRIESTYAHLICPLMISYKKPTKSNPVGAPVREVPGSFGFNISAQIFVPVTYRPIKKFDRLNTIWVIGALIRLITESPLLIPIISNTSFSEGLDTPKNQLAYWPIEIERKQLVVSQNKNATLQDEILSWVRNNWQSAIKLMVKYPEFMVAIEAFDKARFAPSYPLGLLQLWSALESIFSPDRGELRFRVSALIATFLESAGENRLKEQRKIARLYDARSAAAHGRAEDAETPFMESYALFRKILMRMIEMKTVPKSDDLRQMLLQGSSYID